MEKRQRVQAVVVVAADTSVVAYAREIEIEKESSSQVEERETRKTESNTKQSIPDERGMRRAKK